MRAAIVVPTIRKEHIRMFLQAWGKEFEDHVVIVVEDNPERSFDISSDNVKHFSWADIDAELGSSSWIVPRRTDCVRSYGYWKAYHESVDMIVTLDDDCHPSSSGFLDQHHERLSTPTVSHPWVSTGRGVAPRGMPYQNGHRGTECVINHGLWTNIPDFDAMTQLVNGRMGQPFEHLDQAIPVGSYFPMCGMNLAFRREVAPAMYFLLMGQPSWPFDRFGDIWCGLFVKKICDHLGLGVKSGNPVIHHQRASNVWSNLRKELPGYEVNETLWERIDSVVLTGDTFKECYAELGVKLPMKGEYWDSLKKAMVVWSELF
jgi:reversibly glycosylated polypeptide/UDP-arabinopyranose mutase